VKKAVCRALIGNLIDRGLDTESTMLFVINGGMAIRAAIKDAFGDLALIQRCRKHKKQNRTSTGSAARARSLMFAEPIPSQRPPAGVFGIV
jgi:hypothetical protein